METRAVEGVGGSGVPYAYAVKAGPWLFLSGHEAFDFAAGSAPEVDGPAGFPSFGAPRLKREAQYLIARMKKLLGEFGSDLKHSVRVDQYYTSFEAVRAYQLARHSEFGDYIPPSTSVVMKRLFNARSSIQMSMLAVVPGKDYAIERIYPKEVPVPAGSFFVPAIACNDFVFVAGQMASDETQIVPSLRLSTTRNWGGPNAVRRQTEFVIKERLAPALAAAGSSFAQALKAQIYVPSAADIPDALDVWRSHVPHACALTAVPTQGFGFVEGVLEINLLALRDGARRRKEVLKVDLPPMSAYGECIRAGELVFPSGLMAIAGDAGFDGLSHASQVQALALLSCAERVCKAAGTSLANIVRAQYFMSDVRELPGVALAWMSRLGKQPHPFVCVQVPGELPAPGAALVADYWIYAP